MRSRAKEDLYTTVVGVDAKHLDQLALVWPTWRRHKPGVLHRVVVFYDRLSVKESQLRTIIGHRPVAIDWPPVGVEYPPGDDTKWTDPQRHRMLAGFIHVPPTVVETPYWLKLDTDVVADSRPKWIDRHWFRRDPAIIAQPWGYTKPPDQITRLDVWVDQHRDQMEMLAHRPALDLRPNPGSDLVRHKRVISWCGFFSTAFTRYASELARRTVGEGLLPVPSQDGYLWYVATRLGLNIRRVQMKDRGWQWWSATTNVRRASIEALKNGPM